MSILRALDQHIWTAEVALSRIRRARRAASGRRGARLSGTRCPTRATCGRTSSSLRTVRSRRGVQPRRLGSHLGHRGPAARSDRRPRPPRVPRTLLYGRASHIGSDAEPPSRARGTTCAWWRPRRCSSTRRRWNLGSMSLTIHHLPGHTPDCCVAFVPERGLLLVGDTAETPFPVVPEGCPLAGWIAGLERWAADERVQTVVPAHGAVGGREILREQHPLSPRAAGRAPRRSCRTADAASTSARTSPTSAPQGRD